MRAATDAVERFFEAKAGRGAAARRAMNAALSLSLYLSIYLSPSLPAYLLSATLGGEVVEMR